MPTRGTYNQGSHNTAAAVNQMEYWHCVNDSRRTSTPNLDNRFVANSSTANRSSAGYSQPHTRNHIQDTHNTWVNPTSGTAYSRRRTWRFDFGYCTMNSSCRRLAIIFTSSNRPSWTTGVYLWCPQTPPTPSVPQLRGTHNTRDELDFVVSEQRAVWRYGQHVEVDCFRLPHLPGHKASKQRRTRRHTGVRHRSVAITRWPCMRSRNPRTDSGGAYTICLFLPAGRVSNGVRSLNGSSRARDWMWNRGGWQSHNANTHVTTPVEPRSPAQASTHDALVFGILVGILRHLDTLRWKHDRWRRFRVLGEGRDLHVQL